MAEHKQRVREKLRWAAQSEWDTVKNWAATTILVLPLAMLWGDGIVAVVGTVYFVPYASLMAYDGVVMLGVVHNVGRVLRRRDAPRFAFLLASFAECDAGTWSPQTSWGQIRREKIRRFIAAANPFTNLAYEAVGLVLRFRPEAMEQMRETAKTQFLPLEPLSAAEYVAGRVVLAWATKTKQHAIPARSEMT